MTSVTKTETDIMPCGCIREYIPESNMTILFYPKRFRENLTNVEPVKEGEAMT